MENKKLVPKEKMMCSLCSEAKQKIRSRAGEASKYGNFITFFTPIKKKKKRTTLDDRGKDFLVLFGGVEIS